MADISAICPLLDLLALLSMKLSSRIVSLLLIPCFISDPATASALNYPLSLGRGPTALGVRGDVVTQIRFEEEALAEELISEQIQAYDRSLLSRIFPFLKRALAKDRGEADVPDTSGRGKPAAAPKSDDMSFDIALLPGLSQFISWFAKLIGWVPPMGPIDYKWMHPIDSAHAARQKTERRLRQDILNAWAQIPLERRPEWMTSPIGDDGEDERLYRADVLTSALREGIIENTIEEINTLTLSSEDWKHWTEDLAAQGLKDHIPLEIDSENWLPADLRAETISVKALSAMSPSLPGIIAVLQGALRDKPHVSAIFVIGSTLIGRPGADLDILFSESILNATGYEIDGYLASRLSGHNDFDTRPDLKRRPIFSLKNSVTRYGSALLVTRDGVRRITAAPAAGSSIASERVDPSQNSHTGRDDVRRAVMLREKLRRQFPVDPKVIRLTKAAMELLNQGEKAKALALLDQALTISPINPVTLRMKAGILVRLRRFSEALQMCKESLKLEPDNFSAYLYGVRALNGQKKFDEARKFAEPIIQKKLTYTTDPEGYTLAQLLHDLSLPEQALEIIDDLNARHADLRRLQVLEDEVRHDIQRKSKRTTDAQNSVASSSPRKPPKTANAWYDFDAYDGHPRHRMMRMEDFVPSFLHRYISENDETSAGGKSQPPMELGPTSRSIRNAYFALHDTKSISVVAASNAVVSALQTLELTEEIPVDIIQIAWQLMKDSSKKWKPVFGVLSKHLVYSAGLYDDLKRVFDEISQVDGDISGSLFYWQDNPVRVTQENKLDTLGLQNLILREIQKSWASDLDSGKMLFAAFRIALWRVVDDNPPQLWNLTVIMDPGETYLPLISYPAFSDEDVRVLWPILESVLRRILVGKYKVIVSRGHDNQGDFLRIWDNGPPLSAGYVQNVRTYISGHRDPVKDFNLDISEAIQLLDYYGGRLDIISLPSPVTTITLRFRIPPQAHGVRGDSPHASKGARTINGSA